MWLTHYKKSQDNRLKVGIIGLGKMSEIHLSTLSANKSVEIEAVAEINPQLLKQKQNQYGFKNAYRDYHKILEDKSIAAVDIILPHYLHAQIVCEALLHGKSVICEKPLALKDADFVKIGKIEKTTHQQAHAKHYLRHSYFHCELRDLVRQGKIGKIRLVDFNYHADTKPDMQNRFSWRGNLREAGGGIFQDVGIHAVDMLVGMFGRPKSVFAIMQKIHSKLSFKGEDQAVVCLSYPEMLVTITCDGSNTAVAPGWQKTFWGDLGTLKIEDLGKSRQKLSLIRNYKKVFEKEDVNWWDKTNQNALNEIIGKIIHHQPPTVSLMDARLTQRIITAAYLSAKSRKQINFKYA